MRLSAASTFPNAKSGLVRHGGLPAVGGGGDAWFGGDANPGSFSFATGIKRGDEHDYPFAGGGSVGNALALFEDDDSQHHLATTDNDDDSTRQPQLQQQRQRQQQQQRRDGHNHTNKKRGREARHGDRGDRGGAKRRNTRGKRVKSGAAQAAARQQRHADELDYLNGIVESQASALYGALHSANGGQDSLATDGDGDDSERGEAPLLLPPFRRRTEVANDLATAVVVSGN